MRRTLLHSLLLVLALYGTRAPSQEIRRVVLSPWSSEADSFHYGSPVLRHVEVILNHLGVYVDYFDIDTEPYPDVTSPDFSKKYLGVLTFFDTESLAQSKKLVKWLADYSKANLPWVALGQFGFLDEIEDPELSKFFSRFGVSYAPLYPKPIVVRVAHRETGRLGFERELELAEYPPLAARARANHWLKLSSGVEDPHSSAVFVSPGFSVAYGNYGLFTHADKWRRQWVVDPYEFFRAAFAIPARAPVPETSVLNGRRVFFSHIDGDAFNSVSKMRDSRYCGEVVEEEILRQYSNLPFGVSFIASEIRPKEQGNEKLEAAARRIFALPNVEPASHTYYHPLDWGDAKLSYSQKGLNLRLETIDSIEYLKTLAGRKEVRVLYWSGNCMPSVEAFKFLSDGGYLNINGGDSRFDSSSPSRAKLSPLGRPVGKYFQVFTGNANDNIYTNGWKGPLGGFSRVIETFERTGSPRILKPVNPNFHFFAGELKAGIDALKKVLNWSREHELAQVYPSAYIRSVLGFRSSAIEKISDSRWRVRVGDGLATLRLDSEERIPDMKASRGVLGFRRLQGALYVHLAPGTARDVTLALAVKPHASPYIESVGGTIESAELSLKKLIIELGAFSRPPLILKGLRPGSARILIDGKSTNAVVSGDQLEIMFPERSERQRVEVNL